MWSAKRLNPIVIFDELEARRVRAGIEAPQERQRDSQPEKSEDVPHPAMQVGTVARDEEHQNRAHQRRE